MGCACVRLMDERGKKIQAHDKDFPFCDVSVLCRQDSCPGLERKIHRERAVTFKDQRGTSSQSVLVAALSSRTSEGVVAALNNIRMNLFLFKTAGHSFSSNWQMQQGQVQMSYGCSGEVKEARRRRAIR